MRTRRVPTVPPAVPYCAIVCAPFGRVGIRTRADAIVRIDYLPPVGPVQAACNPLAREACRQIAAYVADARHRFDLPYVAEGTDFQQRVWRQIAAIAYGSTRTYGDLARALDSAPRAVGGACGSNPVPLVVPCHRVVAAGGGLGGFMHSRAAHPLDIKRWLLRHEGC